MLELRATRIGIDVRPCDYWYKLTEKQIKLTASRLSMYQNSLGLQNSKSFGGGSRAQVTGQAQPRQPRPACWVSRGPGSAYYLLP